MTNDGSGLTSRSEAPDVNGESAIAPDIMRFYADPQDFGEKFRRIEVTIAERQHDETSQQGLHLAVGVGHDDGEGAVIDDDFQRERRYWVQLHDMTIDRGQQGVEANRQDHKRFGDGR